MANVTTKLDLLTQYVIRASLKVVIRVIPSLKYILSQKLTDGSERGYVGGAG